MRSILLENDILDGWAYWGYGLNHLRWAISTIARRLNRSCTQTHPLRIAGEVHYNSDLRWLREGLLRELGSDAPIRPLATRCECKIALVTRLREPLSFYTSFWRWAGLPGKQRNDSARYGASMIAWARRYRNLQSTLLLLDTKAALAPQFIGIGFNTAHAAEETAPFWCFDGPVASWPRDVFGGLATRKTQVRRCNATGGEGEARLATLRRSLKAFDVVGTLERFDETLLLVADAVGLQRLLHPPVQPRAPWAPAPGRDADAAQRADGRAQAMGCRDDAACSLAIREAAPVDHIIYDEVNAAFDAKVAALGPPFAERVANLKAAREERRRRDGAHLDDGRTTRAVDAIRPRRVARWREADGSVIEGFFRQRETMCRGLFGGEGRDGEALCGLVRADSNFHLPWREAGGS